MVACLPLSVVTEYFLLLASFVHCMAVALRKDNKEVTKCGVRRASSFPGVQNINRSEWPKYRETFPSLYNRSTKNGDIQQSLLIHIAFFCKPQNFPIILIVVMKIPVVSARLFCISFAFLSEKTAVRVSECSVNTCARYWEKVSTHFPESAP